MQPMQMRCEGCMCVCYPIPMPMSYLVGLISGSDKTTKTALSILHGHEIPFQCQKKDRIMLVPLNYDGAR